MTIQAAVLCGGSGTRLWPLSREQHPKQLLALHGNQTLLQDTVCRLDGLAQHTARPIILCNEEHRFLVAEQVRALNVRPRAIVLEPRGKGTAPALTLAALHTLSENDAVLVAMPSDHVITDRSAFRSAILEAAALAVRKRVVALGVPPDAPETGYGYIRVGPELQTGRTPVAHEITAFVEKPGADAARSFLAEGSYLWNSGIFVVLASVWIESIGRFQPDMLAACREAYRHGARDGDFYRVESRAFTQCRDDSIDYAVMERLGAVDPDNAAIRGATVRLEAGWSDVGAWDALWKIGEKDVNGNVMQGDIHAVGTRNALLIARSRLLACVGLEDVVVVETPDAVMVARKDQAREIKEVVAQLRARSRGECVNHRKVARPWGSYDGVDGGERFQVKRIVVNPGAALSLQMHFHRAEHWVVVRGTARVTRGDEVLLLTENQSTYIPVGMTHRLENPGRVPLEIIEVQSGPYLGEDDIVRFEDSYGRTPKHKTAAHRVQNPVAERAAGLLAKKAGA